MQAHSEALLPELIPYPNHSSLQNAPASHSMLPGLLHSVRHPIRLFLNRTLIVNIICQVIYIVTHDLENLYHFRMPRGRLLIITVSRLSTSMPNSFSFLSSHANHPTIGVPLGLSESLWLKGLHNILGGLVVNALLHFFEDAALSTGACL